MDKLKKNSRLKHTSTLSESKFFQERDQIVTDVPMMNVAMSANINGGMQAGTLILAGPSKHFKSSFALVIASAFQKKYQDGIVLFYDSEFGTPQSYFKNFGVDVERVLHVPVSNIEELKFDLMNQLENLDASDRVMVLIDSIGNLPSRKEVEDALNEKSVADMTRAKAFKSLFRMITPQVNMKEIPIIAVNHTYQTMEMYSKPVVSGGCLVKGTKIKLYDGSVKEIQDIEVNDLLATLEGPKPVTHVWNPDTLENGEPECFEVTFEDGHQVTCSENHPFLTTRGWVEARNLKSTSRLRVWKNIEKQKIMRIKSVKSVGKRKVYDATVKDVHHYLLENGVVTHNTGIMYSANDVWIIGRRQVKEKTEVMGYEFIITIEKSRKVREKSKIPIRVTWEGGIDPDSGLLDVALAGGFIVSPSSGWYQFVDVGTGELVGSKIRAKDLPLTDLLSNQKFIDFVYKSYTIDDGDGSFDLDIEE